MITRSAWRDQARRELDLLVETALVLTATDQAVLETAEEMPPDVLQAFVGDTSEAMQRYVTLAMVLAMAQARIRPMLDAALDGRLEVSRRARLALEAERNRASMDRLRAMLKTVLKAA